MHHRDIQAPDQHATHAWEVADTTERDALVLTADDVGKIARVGASAPFTFYVLAGHAGPTWTALGGGGGGGDVDSVFGRTGAIVAETGDYDVSQITGAVADDDERLSDARPPAIQAPIVEDGTTRTLSAGDHGRTILCTHASGCAIAVPHTLAAGTACIVRALGGAPVTVAGSGGLTVRPSPGCDAEIVDGGTAAIEVESATAAALVGELEESP